MQRTNAVVIAKIAPRSAREALRFERFWLACGFGFVLLVVYLSLCHDAPNPGRMFEIKIGHFVAYGWLMLWFSQIFAAAPTRLRFAAAFCLMGIVLEFVQGLTDYRTFAYSDMLDNGIGLSAALVLAQTRLGNGLAGVEAALSRLMVRKR